MADTIKLNASEVQSGHDRVAWAEGLIRQLPDEHDGRNAWLLNYGITLTAEEIRCKWGAETGMHPLWNEETQSLTTNIALHVFQKPQGLTFGDVIAGIKEGKTYSRKGWNGKGIYITGQFPDEHSKMTQPYIYIMTGELVSDNADAVRGQVPWLASQTDMLAEDWVLRMAR